MSFHSPLNDLIALASEPSSPRRRELLRRVTDVFLQREEITPEETIAFGHVLTPLADAVEQDVRADLAQRLGEAGRAPLELARRLARDCIEVALPILTDSRLLGDDDLIELTREASQAHLKAMASRRTIGEAVSKVIVEHADDATLKTLVANDGAAFTRETNEQIADRAALNPDLHEAMIARASMPLDLVNSLYMLVERRLRERIRERNAAADPEVLEAAFEAARERMARQVAAVRPADIQAARSDIQALAAQRRLTPALLLEFLRAGQSAHFSVGLAHLADVHDEAVALVLRRRDMDGMAILCRAVDMDRAIFLSVSVSLLRGREVLTLAQDYANLFGQIPVETAQRTMRFFRVRNSM